MFEHYFRTTVRVLARNRIYSLINNVGLSLGLTCAMLIILFVKDELTFDLFHKNGSHIFRVNRQLIRDNGDIDQSGYTGLLPGPRFAANIPEIQAFVRLNNGEKRY
jgi:putative ABC transport system permease protein